MKTFKIFILITIIAFPLFAKPPIWGFYAHKLINKQAIYSLPPGMLAFYKKHAVYISENAINPDQRRYAVANEAPKHYIDLDNYADTTIKILPKMFYSEAKKRFGEDSLLAHGIVPWHIQSMVYGLTEAFKEKDFKNILRLSADLGHYIGDANVPLHTTKNYNGQLSNQLGIHGFWESRLPELFSEDYEYWIGKADLEENVGKRAWNAVFQAHAALDSVFNFEKQLTQEMGELKKFSIEERNGINTKTYSQAFSKRYHKMLQNQVNRQMKASIKMVADLWFTAWVNAGQPNLDQIPDDKLILEEDINDKKKWLKNIINARKESDY